MIFVLHGEEYFLIKKEINRIIDQYVSFEKEMNTAIFDYGKNTMEEIIADAQTIPFFSDYKALIVSQADFLGSGSIEETSQKALLNYLDSPNESTILIFTTNQNKLDNRKKIVKYLNKKAKVKSFGQFNDYERGQFVTDYCKQLNLHLSRDALKEFYYRAGYSCARIQRELEKLSLYATDIEKDDVIALVTRPLDDNVFDLFHSLISHDFSRSFRYWKDFDAQNIDPIALIAMLASQYRFLDEVKILREIGLNTKEIANELGAHPYRVEKTLQQCHYITTKEINITLNDLACLDQKIKSGKIDKKFGFEMFLIERGM